VLILPYPDTLRTLQVSLTHRVIRRWHILIPDLEDLGGSTSKEPIPAYATVPYVTSRLDKQDHQIEILGKKMEEGFKETKEGFRDLDRSIHEVESKFHATLSQWLFRAATLVSPPTFTFSHSIANALLLDCWSCPRFSQRLPFPAAKAASRHLGHGKES